MAPLSLLPAQAESPIAGPEAAGKALRNGAGKTIGLILEKAGIRIDGSNPWDPLVHHPRLFNRILLQGSLGLGEAYMEGWWDCEALDEFFARILEARGAYRPGFGLGLLLGALKAAVTGSHILGMSGNGGKVHYEIGNDLYRRMLDKRLVYTCAYWDGARNLDEAQEAKLDLTCRKLRLEPGMRILDIGCGWGSLAKFAAENYGVHVVGITLSEKQAELGRQLCSGFPVEIRLQDYRDIDEPFDRIVSLGMFEHVGLKAFRQYMHSAHRCLKEGGLFLLHTIGENTPQRDFDPWMDKHIFPKAFIPSLSQLTSAFEPFFVMEDWHNLGTDYDRTLMAWHSNFETHWPEVAPAYGDRFRRMWRYYLLHSAAGFRVRQRQLWQIVLSKSPRTKYRSIR